jgi:hypothetical protein
MIKKELFIFVGFFFSLIGIIYYKYYRYHNLKALKLESQHVFNNEIREYYIFDKNNKTGLLEESWKLNIKQSDSNLIIKEMIKEWVLWINDHYKTSLVLTDNVFALSKIGIIIIFKNNFFENCKNTEEEFYRYISLVRTIKQVLPTIQSCYIYRENEIQKSKFLTEAIYLNYQDFINPENSNKQINAIKNFIVKPLYFFANYSLVQNQIYDTYERPILINLLKKYNDNSLLFKPKTSEESLKESLNQCIENHLIGISIYPAHNFHINIIKFPTKNIIIENNNNNSIIVPYFDAQIESQKETEFLQHYVYEKLKKKYPSYSFYKKEYPHKVFDGLILPTIILEVGITNKEDMVILESILNFLLK